MFQNLIQIDRESDKPIFRQLADQLIEQIREGLLPAETKLPGTRKLADLWGLHRKTVIAAIDELVLGGWLETLPGRGTYVAAKIEILPADFQKEKTVGNRATLPKVPDTLSRKLRLTTEKFRLDDGLPDPRLAPSAELLRAYKTAMNQGNIFLKYAYGETLGNSFLREVLAEYLNSSRGMNISKDQILITRGVTQALYLFIQGFVKQGQKVVVPELNWESANVNFIHHGAELIKVKIDEEGLDTDHLEELCKVNDISVLYITPHHQYPTTVIMPAYRRVKLIQLARQYGFYVFEDDYDYDFHYSSHPLMPLASAEHGDYVFYTGSFTKAISPVFRVGYLVAHRDQVDFLARIRRLVDRQGDTILELAIAELMQLGLIQRALKKNKRIYEQRRDYFSSLLESELSSVLSFKKPEGGMSVWGLFDEKIDIPELSKKAHLNDLYFQDGAQFDASGQKINATRVGFASSNETELEQSVEILKRLIRI
ncbi:PLP-dependent aminotransferase family protein [Jiulongibacter sediminis]|jgi:GntR family transcriptional regulator/MocR family aminotransferase|uniref:aminotransferase-like domain-containing protein n=1 Tax=Jiulongibacter sediminis TaxID=1605367 RepID=UPI0026EF1B82|nr:PLP-dependent aminotransferase family protein [Jiulongibacter sediminis]